MDSGGQPEAYVGGLGGPFRRLRAMAPGERVTMLLVNLLSTLVAVAVSWGLSELFHSSLSWFGLVFMAVGLFIVELYLPELVRLFRKWNA